MSTPDRVHIIAWNIQSGGRSRASEIVSFLLNSRLARDGEQIRRGCPDVIVLSEYREGASDVIVKSLRKNGFEYCILPTTSPRIGGAAILSREPLREIDLPDSLSPFSSRYVAAELPGFGLQIRGLYGLLRKEAFHEYWTAVLAALKKDTEHPVLVVGDFNTGQPNFDAPIPKIDCSAYFAQLTECGYTDLWRSRAGTAVREYSWHGRANRYRLDHAFGTATVVERLLECRYHHEPREARTSDHSALSVLLAREK